LAEGGRNGDENDDDTANVPHPPVVVPTLTQQEMQAPEGAANNDNIAPEGVVNEDESIGSPEGVPECTDDNPVSLSDASDSEGERADEREQRGQHLKLPEPTQFGRGKQVRKPNRAVQDEGHWQLWHWQLKQMRRTILHGSRP
jgi:hypothetical protein